MLCCKYAIFTEHRTSTCMSYWALWSRWNIILGLGNDLHHFWTMQLERRLWKSMDNPLNPKGAYVPLIHNCGHWKLQPSCIVMFSRDYEECHHTFGGYDHGPMRWEQPLVEDGHRLSVLAWFCCPFPHLVQSFKKVLGLCHRIYNVVQFSVKDLAMCIG